MSTNEDWKIKVEYAIRTFRSPFVEDIRLSSIATDRELSYLAGQTLAAECLNLQAALSEAREAFKQIDTPLMIKGEAASDADTLDMHEMVARTWLAKWGK